MALITLSFFLVLKYGYCLNLRSKVLRVVLESSKQ